MNTKEPIYEFPDMKPNERLSELILHIADKCEDDEAFGKTMLAKILYFADFESYRKYGKPITGARYIKLENGPFPDGMEALLTQMQTESDIHVRQLSVYTHHRHRVIPLREARLDAFSGPEIAIVDDIIFRLHGKSAKEISEISHGIPWEVSEMTGPIAYETSLILDEPMTQDDTEWLKELAASDGFEF